MKKIIKEFKTFETGSQYIILNRPLKTVKDVKQFRKEQEEKDINTQY